LRQQLVFKNIHDRAGARVWSIDQVGICELAPYRCHLVRFARVGIDNMLKSREYCSRDLGFADHAYSSRRISSGFCPRMRKLAIQPAAFAMSAVTNTAIRLGAITKDVCASRNRLSNRLANPLASSTPIAPATAPSSRNSTENIRLTRQRVAPSVLRITTSRMR